MHDGHFRKIVIGEEREILAELIGNDKGVELSVVLENAGAVNADDLPVAQDERVCADLIRPVQHHRVMPDDDPLFKAAAEVKKTVAAVQLVGGVLAKRLRGVHRGVREDEALRLDGVGKALKKLPLRLEKRAELRFAAREVLNVEGVYSGGVQHIPDKTALFPHHIAQCMLVCFL